MVTWPIPCCLLRLLEWHAPAGRRTVLRWDLVSGSYKDTTPTRWCRETASEPGRQITGEARSRYWRESDQARGRLAPPSSQYWRCTPATHRTAPASGQGLPLGCALRPPSDLRLCAQHRIINGGRRSTRAGLVPMGLGRCSLLVGHPGRTHAVAGGGDVVLLDLLAVLPGLAAPDRQDRVDLPGVVGPVRGDHRRDLRQRRGAAPMHRPRGVQVVHVGERGEPALVGPVEPGEDLPQVGGAHLDAVAQPSGPVRGVPVPRGRLERVGVVDRAPRCCVLGDPQDRPVPAGRVQRLVERHATEVLDECPVGLVQRGPGELDLTHADMMPFVDTRGIPGIADASAGHQGRSLSTTGVPVGLIGGARQADGRSSDQWGWWWWWCSYPGNPRRP